MNPLSFMEGEGSFRELMGFVEPEYSLTMTQRGEKMYEESTCFLFLLANLHKRKSIG